MAVIFGLVYLIFGILNMVYAFYWSGAMDLVLFLSTILLFKSVIDRENSWQIEICLPVILTNVKLFSSSVKLEK